MSDPYSYVFVDNSTETMVSCGFNNTDWLDIIDVYDSSSKPIYMYYYN